MPRPKTPASEARLSRSEWQIMRICWRLGRANVWEILAEDRKHRKRNYRTVLTFASRMAAKGFLRVEKEGKTNYYSPALTHKAGLKREIERFLTEVVGPDPEHLELVRKALDRRQRRRRAPARRKLGR